MFCRNTTMFCRNTTMFRRNTTMFRKNTLGVLPGHGRGLPGHGHVSFPSAVLTYRAWNRTVALFSPVSTFSEIGASKSVAVS